MALKQPLKDKQLIVMSDASFTAAGYAIMIEDDPQQKLQSKRKTYATIAFGSKSFNPTQLKMSIYAKEFLDIFCVYRPPSSRQIFPNKNHSPALWNACDYVLQNNFVIAHVAGAMNTAADFLSRTEMKLRNDIQTKSIEVNIQSSGIAEEERIYLQPDDENDEKTLWEQKDTIRNQAQTERHNDPENEITELQNFH